MKLIGKKRLLANDYKEIMIKPKGSILECRVSGDKRLEYSDVLGGFEKVLDNAETTSLKISEIIKYFIRYAKLHSVREGSFHGRSFIELKGNERILTLALKKDEVKQETIEYIIQSYYDNLYHECLEFIDEHSDCDILIYDSRKSNHYKCINGILSDETNSENEIMRDEVIIANSKSYSFHVINFMKQLINNCNDVIQIRVFPDKLLLLIGQHNIVMPYYEEVKNCCYSHNTELARNKRLQLKIEGI